jgi:ankyrin repeat protein/beta-lactamase regulating signal transducer with metallopeptidase domain
MTPELDILMKVTMVLLLGLIATRLAARARASVRHLLLASTLGALIALPLAAALAPDLVVAIRLPQATDPGTAPTNAAAVARAQAPARPEGLVSSANTSLAGARAAWQASTGMSIPAVLRLLWAAGAVLLLAFLANALRKVRAVRRSGIPWLAGQTAAEALARDSGISRPLTIILHEDVPAPVTCGWSSPTIVFPMDARDWSESDLRRAFVHELEHVRRGDWPMQLAARAICAGYWFHPLVWIAWRQLCLESERACDDAVVNRAEQADYAEQLVTLAERLAHSQAQPVLSMANRSDLSVRVRAVLDRTQLRGRAGASLVAATLVAASIFVLTLAPVRVEAVPDQRSNTAGGRRDPAVGNDRGRASTRALNVAIVEAAEQGDIDEVTELLDDGADVNAVVPGDGTPLLVAAREGHRTLVGLLLDRGADANIGVDGDGNALIMAAREGYRDIVTMLLDRGADVNAAVPGDGNALIMAAREGYRDIVTMLLDRGADVNAAVPGDGNALIMAAREGHRDIVTMLLDRGALIDEVVPGDENALISASGEGDLDVVRLLVGRGADVNARVWAEQGWPDRSGEWRTPLSMAREGGHTSVVRYLQSVGAVE